MKLVLILGVTVVFLSSCFNSAYEADIGKPNPNQYQ